VKQEDPVWKFLYVNHSSFVFGGNGVPTPLSNAPLPASNNF